MPLNATECTQKNAVHKKTGDESIQKPIIYSQEALILDACSGCKSAELIFLVQGSGKSVGVKLCSNT